MNAETIESRVRAYCKREHPTLSEYQICRAVIFGLEKNGTRDGRKFADRIAKNIAEIRRMSAELRDAAALGAALELHRSLEQ